MLCGHRLLCEGVLCGRRLLCGGVLCGRRLRCGGVLCGLPMTSESESEAAFAHVCLWEVELLRESRMQLLFTIQYIFPGPFGLTCTHERSVGSDRTFSSSIITICPLVCAIFKEVISGVCWIDLVHSTLCVGIHSRYRMSVVGRVSLSCCILR